MIQLLLIVSIIICLILLFLKTKENFESDLPSCSTLKATGGNKGIKLTWIKPSTENENENEYIMYYILLFSNKTNRYNVYLYNNNKELLEFHIKNIPNNNTYNVGIMYKYNDKLSPIYMYNYNGNYDVITDKNSPLNFNDYEEVEEVEEEDDNLEEDNNLKCKYKQENVNMELQNIIKLLAKNKNIKQNYNINLL